MGEPSSGIVVEHRTGSPRVGEQGPTQNACRNIQEGEAHAL